MLRRPTSTKLKVESTLVLSLQNGISTLFYIAEKYFGHCLVQINEWHLLQKIFPTPAPVRLSIRCYSHLFRLIKHAMHICSLQTTSRMAYCRCQDGVFVAAYFCRHGCSFAVTWLQQASRICGFNQVLTLKTDNPASIAWFWMVKIYLFDWKLKMWCFLITVHDSGKIFSLFFNLQNDISVLFVPRTKQASLFFGFSQVGTSKEDPSASL